MDVHFNAYKAKYDILDQRLQAVRQAQYVNSMDIFINLDDVIHNMHRPLVEKEAQLCGIAAAKFCAANIINLIAHYKMWAAKKHIQARVFAIYTTTLHHFKNSIYLPNYRDYYSCISSKDAKQFFFVNDAVNKALPIAHNIADYVEDVFMVDSRYLEPSVIPWMLKQSGVANYAWGMMISRDHYDLQYAYRDKWIFVSPKGDNTQVVGRKNLWEYIGAREKVHDIGPNAALYHHNLLPLALSLVGNKYRTIPRLQRIGWKTLFKYLIEVTAQDSSSTNIITSRFMRLMETKGIPMAQVEKNLSCVSIDQQYDVLNEIDKATIADQLKYVSDHDNLLTINQLYFQECPINIPFLTATWKSNKPFS